MNDLILIGGGGHCKSCINVIEETKLFNIIGILDVSAKKGNKILDYSIIGNDDRIEEYIESETSFCMTIGKMNSGKDIRDKLFNKLISLNAIVPVIISNSANVSKYAEIQQGSIVLLGAIINANAFVGCNCIINSQALIEHDAVIGNNCHISTGVIVNGNCRIGNNCMIGSGVVLKNGISIPDNTMIGMGTVVTKTIKHHGLYFGNPARKISK